MEDLYFYLITLILLKASSLVASAYRFANKRISYVFVLISFFIFVLILWRIFF